MGAVLGDGAQLGCGCVTDPCTLLGAQTHAYPLCYLPRGVYGLDMSAELAYYSEAPNDIESTLYVLVGRSDARKAAPGCSTCLSWICLASATSTCALHSLMSSLTRCEPSL